MPKTVLVISLRPVNIITVPGFRSVYQEILLNIEKNIDDNIYGHNETKEQIIRIMAQWISNTNKTGYVIGIKGPPGVGKTMLVKECICKAMNFPFSIYIIRRDR